MSITKRLEVEVVQSSSGGNAYVILAQEDDAGHRFLTCPCKSWTTSVKNRGLQMWERSCKHTEQTELLTHVSRWLGGWTSFEDMRAKRIDPKAQMQAQGQVRAPYPPGGSQLATKKPSPPTRFDKLEL